jgi:hypothetical protein
MCDDCEALRERLDAIEDDVQNVIDERESYRKQVLNPRLDGLEAARDDAQTQRAELQANLETAWKRIDSLEAELDSLVGLAEEETGGPRKRAVDLRKGLIREAREVGGSDETAATMHYKEVQRFFAQTGHGEVKKPDCYKAMRWAAGETEQVDDNPAFWLEDDKRDLNGRSVRAICVDVSDLPTTGGMGTSRSPTTGKTPTTEVNATD